jgi:hypothetical protein
VGGPLMWRQVPAQGALTPQHAKLIVHHSDAQL